MGSAWDQFGVSLKLTGVILETVWVQFGVNLQPVLGQFGIDLVSVGEQPEVILCGFVKHFGSI